MNNINEESQVKQQFADLLGAVVSGLCTGAVMGWMRNSGEVYNNDFIKCVLLATGSYLTVALLITTKTMQRFCKIPSWVLIPLIGAAISFVSIVLIPNEMHGWRFRKEPSLAKYVFVELQDKSVSLVLSVIIDTFIALPIMAAFHYMVPVKRWIWQHIATYTGNNKG